MITKLKYDSQGRFDISGTIKIDSVNFEKKEINSEIFFPLVIDMMLKLKKNILYQLSDDHKILGEERIEVINAVDKFVTTIFAFAFIISKEKGRYHSKYMDLFEIDINLNKMNYLQGSGILSKSLFYKVIDFEKMIDENIISSFKRMIKQFKEKGDKTILEEELIKLIYYSLLLRYRVEYI